MANLLTPLTPQFQPFPAAVLLYLSGVQLLSPHCQIPCPPSLPACMTYTIGPQPILRFQVIVKNIIAQLSTLGACRSYLTPLHNQFPEPAVTYNQSVPLQSPGISISTQLASLSTQGYVASRLVLNQLHDCLDYKDQLPPVSLTSRTTA